jgi:16S rRNA (cytosine1402-N4)-methyltransferase
VSEETPAPPRRRRPRYRGTHPRRFAEKYKELAPDAHPETVARVRGRGQTPAGQHVPIMEEQVLAALKPQRGERGVDATLGWGGHARRLLEAIRPGGCLLALDADPVELPKTEARLRALGFAAAELRVRRTNFARLREALDEAGWHDGADFVFADLGVSSMQLDDPARGFGVKSDGPLDMRMNPRRGPSASEWLARASAARIEQVLRDHADEPEAALLAHALHTRSASFATAGALAAAVRESLRGICATAVAEQSVRRVFQALRIEVNDEFGTLDLLLRQLPGCLRPGGRAVFLSFHSGEDRRVKKCFVQGLRAGAFSAIALEPARASATERRANPRSAPAKLRWAMRNDAPRASLLASAQQ